MKYIFYLFLLPLIFLGGCTKYETEYAVNCQFPPSFFSDSMTLVVSGAEGKILTVFSIPSGANSVTERFSISEENAPDRYDLHLINISSFSSLCFSQVFSHLDVQNGASVYLDNGIAFSAGSKTIVLLVDGIESFDSLQTPGIIPIYNAGKKFYPDEKRFTAPLRLNPGQGVVVRMLANGASDFSHLYLPDSLLNDTVAVSWSDFKPETDIRSIELPNDNPTTSAQLSVVSPDFKQYVTLVQYVYSWNNGQMFSNNFNYPDGMNNPATYAVKVEQNTVAFEKIFLPGEPIRLEPANMNIGDITFKGREISIESDGEIDLIRILTSSPDNNNNCYLHWQVDGSPESFDAHKMPDLSEYLPGWEMIAQGFKHGRVSAFQFDKYDYSQVREGFPFKSSELFAVARSGFRSIWKFK